MVGLALLVIPVLVMEDRATTPELRQGALIVNWIIWLAFVVEFAFKWAADRTLGYPRRAWFDLLLDYRDAAVRCPGRDAGNPQLAAPAPAPAVARVWRGGNGLQASAAAFRPEEVPLRADGGLCDGHPGAVAVFALEVDENKGIRHFGDALWWAITTVTTVGYGDITPVTPEGRLVAVVLMLAGIGVIGVFTATVASLLFEEQQTQNPETDEILALPRADREGSRIPPATLNVWV